MWQGALHLLLHLFVCIAPGCVRKRFPEKHCSRRVCAWASFFCLFVIGLCVWNTIFLIHLSCDELTDGDDCPIEPVLEPFTHKVEDGSG